MNTHSIPRVVGLLVSTIAIAAACTEQRPVQQSPTPVSPITAHLELSDSAARPGSAVIVTVRVAGTDVASATGRIVYDSTALEFIGEEALGDSATRVVNPLAGNLRFAAMAAGGFAGGRLDVMRFMVRRSGALAGMRLVIDEAHTVSRSDVAPGLKAGAP